MADDTQSLDDSDQDVQDVPKAGTFGKIFGSDPAEETSQDLRDQPTAGGSSATEH